MQTLPDQTKLTIKLVRNVETKDKVIANLLFLEPQDFEVIEPIFAMTSLGIGLEDMLGSWL